MTRLAFGYCLASELVTRSSVRVDLRALFVLLEEMVSASNGVHDLAPDEVRMAAEQVVEGIGELFGRLPNLDKPMRRALAAWGGHDDAVAYQEALACKPMARNNGSRCRLWTTGACAVWAVP